MRDPNYLPRSEQAEVRPPGAEEAARDITCDRRAFTAAIRTRIFTFLRALVTGDLDAALATLDVPSDAEGEPWTPARLARVLDAYHAGHQRIRLDPEARNLRHTHLAISDDQRHWRVQQMLIDPAEANDWFAEFEIDLEKSRTRAEPVVGLRRIESL
jgi:hypothetical protein